MAKVLRVQKLKHLASNLGISISTLVETAESPEKHFVELQLIDPSRPEKVRTVLSVNGRLRRIQNTILTKLLRSDPAADCSHGGVRGRSIFSNANAHRNSKFGFKTDISSFYPSIHYKRIYKYFNRVQKCSPDVSRILTRLTTLNHHVPLGLITSPFLADRVVRNVDVRIAEAMAAHDIVYTRFVDDIVLSAKFDLKKSGFPSLVRKVLVSNGFRVNKFKDEFADFQDGLVITGIRVRNGSFDVRKNFANKLQHQIELAKRLGRGEQIDELFATKNQVLGRLMFVKQVNRWRFRQLKKSFDELDWNVAMENAKRFNIALDKKCLVRETS